VEEHCSFVDSLILNGNDWIKAEKMIITRNSIQIRSHYQKFIIKLKNGVINKLRDDPSTDIVLYIFINTYENTIPYSNYSNALIDIKMDKLASLIVHEFLDIIYSHKNNLCSRTNIKYFTIEKDKIKLKAKLLEKFSGLFNDSFKDKVHIPSNNVDNNSFYYQLLNEINKVVPLNNLKYTFCTNNFSINVGEDTFINNTFVNTFDCINDCTFAKENEQLNFASFNYSNVKHDYSNEDMSSINKYFI